MSEVDNTISVSIKDNLRSAVVDALGEAMDCTRVWCAWAVGTMGEQDFKRIRDQDDRVEEIVDAALGALDTSSTSDAYLRLLQENVALTAKNKALENELALIKEAEPIGEVAYDISPSDGSHDNARVLCLHSQADWSHFALGSKLYASPQPACGQPKLKVSFGAMPESNGKSNWTAILYREDLGIYNGITLAVSEHKERARYEAHFARFLIGDLKEEPNLRDYDGASTEAFTCGTTLFDLLAANRLKGHFFVPEEPTQMMIDAAWDKCAISEGDLRHLLRIGRRYCHGPQCLNNDVI